MEIVGWRSLLLIFFGKSAAELLRATRIGETSESWVAPVVTVVACAAAWCGARRACNVRRRCCPCS